MEHGLANTCDLVEFHAPFDRQPIPRNLVGVVRAGAGAALRGIGVRLRRSFGVPTGIVYWWAGTFITAEVAAEMAARVPHVNVVERCRVCLGGGAQ